MAGDIPEDRVKRRPVPMREPPLLRDRLCRWDEDFFVDGLGGMTGISSAGVPPTAPPHEGGGDGSHGDAEGLEMLSWRRW